MVLQIHLEIVTAPSSLPALLFLGGMNVLDVCFYQALDGSSLTYDSTEEPLKSS